MSIRTEVKLDAQTLRAIGQDLEKISLFDFDAQLDGTRCVLRGTVVPSVMEKPIEAESGGWRGWWKRHIKDVEVERPQKAVRTTVERVYEARDILRLDEEGRSRRRTPVGSPDLYATSQMLRVAGAYLEAKHSHVISLVKDGADLNFTYVDGTGNRQSEKRAYSELYDFGFHLSRQRDATRRSTG